MNEERQRGKNEKMKEERENGKTESVMGLTLSYSLFFEALHNTNKKSLNSSFLKINLTVGVSRHWVLTPMPCHLTHRI